MNANDETWQRPPSSIHQGWRYTISIKDFFVDDPTDEQVPPIAAAVADALKTARDYVIESAAGEDLRDLEGLFRSVDTVIEFDDALGELYDWGDEFRVIIH